METEGEEAQAIPGADIPTMGGDNIHMLCTNPASNKNLYVSGYVLRLELLDLGYQP